MQSLLLISNVTTGDVGAFLALVESLLKGTHVKTI